MKKIGLKMGISAVLAVVCAALSAIFIPMPYGAILATLLGIGEGLYLRTFFTNIKE